MKTTEPKTSSANNQSSTVSPFFGKSDDSFFSVGGEKLSPFFNQGYIQATMKTGLPDDPYEKEAEKVSHQVVEGFDQAGNVQRKLSASGLQQFKIHPSIIGSRISKKSQKTLSRIPLSAQAKCSECEEEEKMDLKSGAVQFSGEGSAVTRDLENKIQSMRGGGQAMDNTTKAAMESSFGADFSSVKIHTNNQAVQMSQDLNAHAFTVGNDIFFNHGRYHPSSKQGIGLLAHELTHTVQQGGSVQNGQPVNLKEDKNMFGGSVAVGLKLPTSNPQKNQALFTKEINEFQKTGSKSNTGGRVHQNTAVPGIQKADVLENDLSTVPNNLTCPVSTEKVNDENASLDMTFNQGGTILTAEDITNIAVFVNNWHSSALSVPVRIHGYASKDGTPAINWPLSCGRAEAVSKQMQKIQPAAKLSTGKTFPAGTAGIPAGFVQVFAHGETEEFSKTSLLQNRRVTVFVPNIPALPAKLAKAPQAKLKTGPTYKPNVLAPLTTNTPTNKATNFTMAAEFQNDPPNGILATCGEIRQYIKWSNQNVDPARGGHEGFLTDKTFIPGTFYEDRDQVGKRYGHRQGPHSESLAGVNEFLNLKGKQDPLNGPRFNGRDTPNVNGTAAFITSFAGTWEFRLDAIDTCNGDKVLGTDTVKVNF